MDLILWRHCEAEAGIPDASRKLTPLGAKQAARMARWLSPRLTDDCRIIVSPALRAQQTAQALARRFETDPRLASGANVADVLAAADWPDGVLPALVVGHQPTLGRVAAFLLEGEDKDRALRSGEVLWLASRVGAQRADVVLAMADPPGPC
jgi:phosphohistidine phosphatase